MSERTKPTYSTGTAERNGALPVRSMDEILAELDQRGQPEAVEVAVPEWGTTFRVRGLTRAEVLHMNGSTSRNGRVNQALLDEMTMTTAVVEPKITPEQYRRLRHRADANPIISRLQNKIAELTTGEKVTGPNGEEMDAVDAAYFPADGEAAAPAAR
jgi:hypothetical protein